MWPKQNDQVWQNKFSWKLEVTLSFLELELYTLNFTFIYHHYPQKSASFSCRFVTPKKNPSKKRLTANVRLSLKAPHARSGEGNLINNVTFLLPSLPLAMHTCESQSASDTFRYGFSEARNTRKPGLELKIACQYITGPEPPGDGWRSGSENRHSSKAIGYNEWRTSGQRHGK